MWKPTTVLLVLALALPAPAVAAQVGVPPGNSEADQYFETITGPTGPTTPNTAKTVEDAVREGTLSPAALRALERRGASGEALANAVAQTAPAPVGGGAERGGQAERGGPAASGSGSGPERVVSFKVPDEGGMGIFFPLVLLATGAAAVAYLVDRRRRATAR